VSACLQHIVSTDSAQKALQFLLRTRNADGGWPYTPGQVSAPEPSCYGTLAVCDSTANLEWIDKVGAQKRPGGADPQWTHSLALLTLKALGQRPDARNRIIETLLRAEVKQPASNSKVDIDGSLRGWSWVEGTFSWVEPTSYALLALKSAGVITHPRIQEAERMLLDRTCSDGGWNYGNRVVWGATLKAMTSTTALAALALQRAGGAEKVVTRAMDLLDREVQVAPSSLALALTVLCFDAFGRPSMHLQERLVARQGADGSWRGQPHLTALALLAVQTKGGNNVFKV
jgi:hypothetical protein